MGLIVSSLKDTKAFGENKTGEEEPYKGILGESSPIILFDGLCNFCSSIVFFTIKRDKNSVFKFAPLQSNAGRYLLKRFNLPTENHNSFVLVEQNRFFIKSNAVLRVAKRLGGIWSLLYVFMLVPNPIRDFIYDIMAKNRYRWFGRKEECLVPTPDIKNRFLDF